MGGDDSSDDGSPSTPMEKRYFKYRRSMQPRTLVFWAALVLTFGLISSANWHQSMTQLGRVMGPKKVLPPKRAKIPCDRTFTVEFGGMEWGLGSTTYLQAVAIDWALAQNRTILFDDDDEAIYGSYYDLFEPAEVEPPCAADDELYDVYSDRVCGNYTCVAERGRHWAPVNKNHTAIAGEEFTFWVLDQALSRFSNFDHVLADFPELDSQRPLPITSTIPNAFLASYRRIHELWRQYFLPSPLIREKVTTRAKELKLRISAPLHKRSPFIVLHWRGGDKFTEECKASARMSCGNVTLHAETAWQAYLDLGVQSNGHKPTLAIMSTESDALSIFKADPVAQRFDIMSMPAAHSHGLSHFDQHDFNALPTRARRKDIREFMTNLHFALKHADAVVISALSNSGKMALTMAGEEKIRSGFIRSVDIPWTPGAWPVIPPKCDGREKCFF